MKEILADFRGFFRRSSQMKITLRASARNTFLAFCYIIILFSPIHSYPVQRFPKPEFETAYQEPPMVIPSARAVILEFMDVLVLIAALTLITWFIIKKRSRKGVFWVSLFSLAYFGFYREGCICAIGSIQNVTLALFDRGYVIPLTVVAFFVTPLVFTLFFGRTFCAGVCPFGAMQDMVALAPQKVGSRLNAVLGVIPYLYLGLAVLYAATGTDFIICRYDPFVGIFRFNATFGMFLFAGALLLCGIFLARPYCRFLCPYGVLLNWFSRFSRKHITITPTECIQCRLCEDSCPYDAISMPLIGKNPEDKRSRRKKLMMASFLVPFLVVAGGYLGSAVHGTLASVNKKVQLAQVISDPKTLKSLEDTYEIKAFRSSGKTTEQVISEGSGILNDFRTGGWIFGGFMGLVFGLLIARRMITTYRADYVPDKGRCFSCVRCVDYCPIKK
jgi:NosR/NirI family transcriptional regulator, nitrous oxide reductase regulator